MVTSDAVAVEAELLAAAPHVLVPSVIEPVVHEAEYVATQDCPCTTVVICDWVLL